MKNKRILMLLTILIIMGLAIFSINIKSLGATTGSFSVSSSASQLKINDTATLTITTSNCEGQFSISSSNPSVISISSSSEWVSGSKSITLQAKGTGAAVITITATNVGDNQAVPEDVTGSKTITLNVANPIQNDTQTNSEKSNTTNNSTATENQKTTEKTVTEQKKSNNANLIDLGIRPNDFSGFKPNTTSYDVTVPNNVEEVEVYAKLQDSKATISGTGKRKLQIGKNSLTVNVKAEDGTQKTYTINVTRDETKVAEDDKKEQEEKEEKGNKDVDEISKGLAQLKVDGIKLEPEFKTDIYEYKLSYEGEESKLDITAIATDVDYEVEITGNDNFKEGENIITILVSDKDKNNVATYQIKVDKKVKEIANNIDDELMLDINNKKNSIILAGIVTGSIVVIIIVVIIINRIKNKDDDDYDYDDYDDYDGIPEYKGNNQLEDFDENMKYKREDTEDYNENLDEIEENKNDEQFDSNIEDYEEDDEFEDTKVKRRKHKGKRFK